MKKYTVLFFAACAFVLMAGKPAFAVQLTLLNGDKITGDIVSENELAYHLQTPYFGVLKIDKNVVKTDKPQAPSNDPDQKEDEVKWAGSATAGLDLERGNKDSTGLYFEGEIKRESKRNESSLSGEVVYGAGDGKMDAQRHMINGRTAFKFGKENRYYHFYDVKYDHDKFANIDYRFVPNLGLGYKYAVADDFSGFVELGAGYSHTTFTTDKEDEKEVILTPRFNLRKRLFDRLTFVQDIIVYPSLTETGDFRLRSDSSLETPITEKASLTIKVTDEYNSNPGEDTKKNDVRLTTGVTYNFL